MSETDTFSKSDFLQHEAVVTHATVGIIVTNETGQIQSVNLLARQLLGYGDELIGQSVEVLVPLSVSQLHQRLRLSYTQHPQTRAMGHNRELHARRKDGTVFPVEISLSYFRVEEKLYVVAYLIDITFKKETERELIEQKQRIEKLNAELEQKVADRTQALLKTLTQLNTSKDELTKALQAERNLGELKSRFVAMASHEFRTPLTAITTSASLIEKYTDTRQQPQRVRHIERIRQSINHLNDILEEFLSAGRLESGQLAVHVTRVALQPLLAETLDDLQGLLKPQQTIRTRIDGQPQVWLDGSLLRKIILNLVSNAVKYSGESSVVTIAISAQAGQLLLTVEDEGIGISAADQAHLFERFFRANNALHIAGTGLGLHLVARYLELLHGQISLTSQLDKGTSVRITIPYENDSAH